MDWAAAVGASPLNLDVLEELGYAALTASDGASALKVLEHEERIDLLVSDVGSPGGMDGRQLADAARARRPGLTILFITGFAESAAMGNGAMEGGMAFPNQALRHHGFGRQNPGNDHPDKNDDTDSLKHG